MKISRELIMSAIVTALILFFALFRSVFPFSLTKTVNTVPEQGIEFYLKEEFYDLGGIYRKDRAGLGIGLLKDLTLWFEFQYLTKGFVPDKSETGDFFLSFWYYLNDYIGGRVHLGLLFDFRIPTGRNAYSSEEWRNLSFGNNELRIGPVMRIDCADSFFVHLNLFYTFRQGENEDFYGGLYINPVNATTYTSVCGLNPFSRDAFLYSERLKNDYITVSCGINTNHAYPFIPFFECHYSYRLYRGTIETEKIPVEGAGIDPLLLSAGVRYFFSRRAYFGAFFVINPLWQENYIKSITGFDFSLLF